MATTMLDSVIYGAAWGDAALRDLFDEESRTRDWLEILAVLAETQGEMDVIPVAAARDIAKTCRGIGVDTAFLAEVRDGRQASGHSTYGLIEAIKRRCRGIGGQYVYYGATVQDLTDTWLMRALRNARALMDEDLVAIAAALTELARTHRDTLMLGRTHGQPGLPITFGFKAAIWLVEVRRHRRRLAELAERMDVGQLCGGVGSLASHGPAALELQERFCHKLGLRAPLVSWTTSRDVLCEWAQLWVLVTGTGDRIGHEIYNLQRPELGEVSEGTAGRVVGSITMPHKRNPELSEHLGTLSRVVRYNAAALAEGLVHDHERDGRSWKVEWHVIPEVTLMSGQALVLLRELLTNLEVHAERMRQNVENTGGLVLSEALMLALAEHTGRSAAHEVVYELARTARETGSSLLDAALFDPRIIDHLTPEALEALFDYDRHIGQCANLVDRVLGEAP